MFRVTTPTLAFDISLKDWTEIEYAKVCIRRGSTLIERIIENPESSDDLTVVLTQEETKKLPAGTANVQIRFFTDEEAVFATEVQDIHICETLDDDVLERLNG